MEDVEQKYAAEAVHCLLKDMKMKSYVVCLNNYCRQFVKSEYAFNGFTVLSAEENAGSLAVN